MSIFHGSWFDYSCAAFWYGIILLCFLTRKRYAWLSHTYKDDSSSGVVVSEGGDIFFGALQNPRPNFLVLDIFEVLDAMTPPMLEELAVLDGSHMGFPS